MFDYNFFIVIIIILLLLLLLCDYRCHYCTLKRIRWSRGSVLSFGTQVRGLNPAEAVGFFRPKNILSTASFGR